MHMSEGKGGQVGEGRGVGWWRNGHSSETEGAVYSINAGCLRSFNAGSNSWGVDGGGSLAKLKFSLELTLPFRWPKALWDQNTERLCWNFTTHHHSLGSQPITSVTWRVWREQPSTTSPTEPPRSGLPPLRGQGDPLVGAGGEYFIKHRVPGPPPECQSQNLRVGLGRSISNISRWCWHCWSVDHILRITGVYDMSCELFLISINPVELN